MRRLLLALLLLPPVACDSMHDALTPTPTTTAPVSAVAPAPPPMAEPVPAPSPAPTPPTPPYLALDWTSCDQRDTEVAVWDGDEGHVRPTIVTLSNGRKVYLGAMSYDRIVDYPREWCTR